MVKAAAVFCGSRLGAGNDLADVAADLGRGLAENDLTLVYGGGKSGLMGVVADAALTAGGQVVGVIPKFLHRREVMHEGISDLIVTHSMHERKSLMFERADVFIVLPGGLGTFDELFEIMTWRQLGLHDKPIIILNHGGWADPLLLTLDATIDQGFADPDARDLYEVAYDVSAVLARLKVLQPTSNVEVDRF